VWSELINIQLNFDLLNLSDKLHIQLEKDRFSKSKVKEATDLEIPALRVEFPCTGNRVCDGN